MLVQVFFRRVWAGERDDDRIDLDRPHHPVQLSIGHHFAQRGQATLAVAEQDQCQGLVIDVPEVTPFEVVNYVIHVGQAGALLGTTVLTNWNNDYVTDTLKSLAYRFAEGLAAENPRFDRTRFLKACGVEQ